LPPPAAPVPPPPLQAPPLAPAAPVDVGAAAFPARRAAPAVAPPAAPVDAAPEPDAAADAPAPEGPPHEQPPRDQPRAAARRRRERQTEDLPPRLKPYEVVLAVLLVLGVGGGLGAFAWRLYRAEQPAAGPTAGELVLRFHAHPPEPGRWAPPPPGPVRLAFYASDRVVALEPPDQASLRAEFGRDSRGRVAWLRWGGRVSPRLSG